MASNSPKTLGWRLHCLPLQNQQAMNKYVGKQQAANKNQSIIYLFGSHVGIHVLSVRITYIEQALCSCFKALRA
jgi:hypothetical protein